MAAPSPAVADPGDAARAARAVDRASAVLENATAQARAAALRLQAATAAMPAAQRRVATSRGALAAAITAANTAGRRANVARVAYAKIAGTYQQAQAEFADARTRVDEIAQATYMGSTFSRINVLVEATGPADIMDRLSLVDQLMRTQQQDADRLIQARRTARSAQDQAGLAKREAEESEALAQGKLMAAKGAQVAALRAKQALQQLMLSRQAALRLANAQRAAVLARYREAVAEEQRIRAALRGWALKSGEGRYGGGQLLMPVNGWKSSDFGERYDPYYRVWQLHAGTDFAAPRGTPIHAAATGHVIRAGWNGGYGNYTCISHGRLGGVVFQTCYGHQSAILVHVGEYVRRGEVIGRVGTTGASTGNHLHFETRFDGVPRNPLQYLPSCLC
ncbi:M23 family metallopeptidase [Paractinoplanes globisporus]|uniref:Peptidoglycan DD-metalloendopeptidase family protein n=1 Tax=Paractinoplanes globisporus TaxID=113565 RepID=A0ABW6WDH9_9ACTN|nr:M23 family metallopeptidase [Actinoplanes globisporus]